MVDEAGGRKTTKISDLDAVLIDLGDFSANHEAGL